MFSIVPLPADLDPGDCFENDLTIKTNLPADHVLYAYRGRQDFEFVVNEEVFRVEGLAGLVSDAFKDALRHAACLIRLRKI